MAEEDKVKWKLGQQKTFGHEGIDRPNMREMQEYITGKDMMDFYKTASKEQIKAVNQLASDLIYGGKGRYISASQWDNLLGSKDYQTKMQGVGSNVMDLANTNTRENYLRLKEIGLQQQVDLPEGELPRAFNQMQSTFAPKQPQSIITGSGDTSGNTEPSGDTKTSGGALISKAKLRERRSLLGG